MTLSNRDREQGFEPDECFYLASAARVQHKQKIDLTIDPPPDLAIETEVSRTILSRLGIYAACRIPEVWTWDGGLIKVLHLSGEGRYHDSELSLVLPGFPFGEATRFIEIDKPRTTTEATREFRTWIRARVTSS